jgi:mannose-1-phosphate guanylyltransferase/mannose-6-phosphate isomerase
VERLKSHLKYDEIYIVTSSAYFHDVLSELSQIPKENILVEPERKNTAPAIAYAMKCMLEKGIDKNETLLVLPADHMIHPVEKFCEYLKEAEVLAKTGGIVTFGIAPSRPETGFGYIQAEGNKVLKFVEKPNVKKAQEYILAGNYFWNSGMFAFTFQTMLAEFDKFCPEIFQLFSQDTEKCFSHLPSISFDYAIMEKSAHVQMIAMHLQWSDVGSWDNVYDMLEKDENQNAFTGDVVMHQTTNSLVLSEKRLVTTIGVSDLLIIETKDAVLIAKREESQKVKEMVETLKMKGASEVETHLTTHRPWGSYTVLEEGMRYKIKRIHVEPKSKLSLQLHYHRSEHWIIVTGTAKVTINDTESLVHEGQSIFVPKSSIHRVENPGKVPLEIIEVQVGEYLGEDDIVRLEDIYGRLKQDAAFALLKEGLPL